MGSVPLNVCPQHNRLLLGGAARFATMRHPRRRFSRPPIVYSSCLTISPVFLLLVCGDPFLHFLLDAFGLDAFGASLPDLVDFSRAQRGGSIIKPISGAALAMVDNIFVEIGSLDTDQFDAPYAAAFEPLPSGSLPGFDTTPSLVQARVHKWTCARP